jgi:hypothetical protein
MGLPSNFQRASLASPSVSRSRARNFGVASRKAPRASSRRYELFGILDNSSVSIFGKLPSHSLTRLVS